MTRSTGLRSIIRLVIEIFSHLFVFAVLRTLCKYTFDLKMYINSLFLNCPFFFFFFFPMVAQDENCFTAGRGAYLTLKRAEKARTLVNKLPCENCVVKVTYYFFNL